MTVTLWLAAVVFGGIGLLLALFVGWLLHELQLRQDYLLLVRRSAERVALIAPGAAPVVYFDGDSHVPHSVAGTHSGGHYGAGPDA